MVSPIDNVTLRGVNLHKGYKGRSVVKGVDLELTSGQVVGLLGPNGAGKTTSFYMMVGLVKPDEGEIWLKDQNISELSLDARARKGIAYLPQEPSIFRKMSVKDNILAILELRNLSHQEQQSQLESLIHEFSLEKIANQKGFTLSGGERRRVEVARALALDPYFLLLDEPFAGIDPIAVADIQKMIKKLKNRGIGVLITDHNVRETLSICDWGYILSEGKIMEKGSPSDIAKSETARKNYLGEDFKF